MLPQHVFPMHCNHVKCALTFWGKEEFSKRCLSREQSDLTSSCPRYEEAPVLPRRSTEPLGGGTAQSRLCQSRGRRFLLNYYFSYPSRLMFRSRPKHKHGKLGCCMTTRPRPRKAKTCAKIPIFCGHRLNSHLRYEPDNTITILLLLPWTLRPTSGETAPSRGG